MRSFCVAYDEFGEQEYKPYFIFVALRTMTTCSHQPMHIVDGLKPQQKQSGANGDKIDE